MVYYSLIARSLQAPAGATDTYMSTAIIYRTACCSWTPVETVRNPTDLSRPTYNIQENITTETVTQRLGLVCNTCHYHVISGWDAFPLERLARNLVEPVVFDFWPTSRGNGNWVLIHEVYYVDIRLDCIYRMSRVRIMYLTFINFTSQYFILRSQSQSQVAYGVRCTVWV